MSFVYRDEGLWEGRRGKRAEGGRIEGRFKLTVFAYPSPLLAPTSQHL